MTSLDTNVVLRFLLNDTPNQTERAAAAITNSECYVTDVIITEVIYVLEKAIGLNRSTIVRLIKGFLAIDTITYNPYFLSEVIDLYGSKKTLSIIDCYAAVEAKAYQNQLVTFDRALIKQGGDHVSGL